MIKTNRLDAGPVDSPVTASSTEESGDILPFFFVGRALAANGGTNIVYTRDLADKGVPISVKMTPTTTGSYIRWMFPHTYGRFVVRRAFMRTEELTGPLTLIEVRHGVTGATVGRLQLTAEGEPVLTVGITRHLATRGQVIPLNTLVWVEYAINTDIQTAEYRITDNEGAVLSGRTHTNSGYLTGSVSDVRFGSTVDQWQAVDYIAGIQAGSLASGWLGPISQSVPLPTPRPWVTRVKTPTLGQTDGEISIAWYPVYGAASYRVVLDDDEILPVTGNTHTFTGVPPGEHRISVQAIAGPPPPRAMFVHELTGSNLAVDATKTTGAVSYAWAFGDGETSTQGPTTTHTYATPGTYKITLAVSDAIGRTSTFSRLITISSVSPARHPADWDDDNLPWSYATTDAFTEGFTEGITWTDLYTGTFAQSDLWSRITYTIAQVPGNGRVYVRIPTGVHNVTSFQTPFVIQKNPLYAFGLWFPRLSGLLGDGPDKTRIHLVANSYSQEQLDALATLNPDTFTPLGNAFARFDGAVTPFLLGGIKFTAADQQNVTALHPNMAAKHGIVVPQPAPHVGIHFEPAPSNGTSEFIVNNCAFVGCARALLGQPPFECGLINSQYTKSVFRRCDFDGRRDAEVDPLRPRRSTTALVNNEKDMSFVDCHFHHSNIGRFAGNDQNKSPAALSTFYNFIRCKFDHMGDEGNTDPLINGGAPLGGVDTRYISPFGFESTNARIRLTDCIITQNTTYARGGIAITQVGRNPSGGRMEVVDCVFRYEHKPYLNGFATMMIDPSTPWYKDGPATTTSVSREETPLTCHVYPTGSSWPPTEAYITAQGLTPETHYIVRRY